MKKSYWWGVAIRNVFLLVATTLILWRVCVIESKLDNFEPVRIEPWRICCPRCGEGHTFMFQEAD